MSNLVELAQHRDDLLLAEIGAWLHNFGKYSEAFLYSQFADAGNTAYSGYASYKYQHIVGVVADIYTAPSSGLSQAAEQRLRDMLGTWDVDKTVGFLLDHHHDFVRWLRETAIRLPSPLGDREYAVGEIIEFQDYKWYRGTSPLIHELYPAGSRATELLEYSHNAGSGVEKEGVGSGGAQQNLPVYASTAFGYEYELQTSNWQAGREKIISEIAPKIVERREALRPFLQHALGDTRRPVNEVTLWDLSSSVAAFYKAGLARVILENQWTQRQDFRWRTLWVAVDGLRFYGNMYRLPDMLARQQTLTSALEEVRRLVEDRIPLGLEVYRDENGSIFIVPDLQRDDAKGTLLKRLIEQDIQQAFAVGLTEQAGGKMAPQLIVGEVMPTLLVSSPHPTAMSIVEHFRTSPPPLATDHQRVGSWWHGKQFDICPVCGLRPQADPDPKSSDKDESKAGKRKVCVVCEQRRASRAKTWAGNLQSTIWTDEVADNNGRMALLVGRFDLDHWLDGSLIQALTVSEPQNGVATLKNPSFARIRRVWETTRTFWQDIQRDFHAPECVGTVNQRLAIAPELPDSLDVGFFHACELVVQGIRVSVVWDSNNRRFITCDNLASLSRPELLGRDLADMVKPGSILPLEEPTGYGSANRKLGAITVQRVEPLTDVYTPAISILAEPRTFMALVPANRAVAVVQAIKEKYAAEMGKVRNRLPLTLGVVYAGRRTPLASLLEAGRRMLRRPAGAVQAEVQELTPQNPLPDGWPSALDVKLKIGEREIVIGIPTVMGDDATPDLWYPYWQAAGKPTDRKRWFVGPNGEHWVHVCDLRKGDEVAFTPSTFDYEYLDASARRFEVAYDDDGQRMSQDRRQRPYLLEQVDDLETTWDRISRLPLSQIKGLEALIEAKRRDWSEPIGTLNVSDAFCRLVAAALHESRIHDPALERAAISGMLADALEIHLTIHKDKPQ